MLSQNPDISSILVIFSDAFSFCLCWCFYIFFFSHFATISRKSETLQPMMVYFPVAIKKNQDSISELSVI